MNRWMKTSSTIEQWELDVRRDFRKLVFSKMPPRDDPTDQIDEDAEMIADVIWKDKKACELWDQWQEFNTYELLCEVVLTMVEHERFRQEKERDAQETEANAES